MSQNNIKFKKNEINKTNFNEKSDNSQSSQQNEKIKKKLMSKYEISEKDAEILIKKIEKKLKKKNNYHRIPQKKYDADIKSATVINKQQNKNKQLSNLNPKVEEKNSEITKSTTKSKNSKIPQKVTTINTNKNKMRITDENDSVDKIIMDIIPDYNAQVSIELNNVNLTFKVNNEKIDTLKETFIKTVKRNNQKKINIHALESISFKIYKGEKVGIIGFNGAGKSTLLKVISGIYVPDSGIAKTYGKISPLLSLGAGFDFNYSGRKNIILNGAVLGYDKQFLESKMDEIIEFSELGDFIDIPIKNYSSGMLAKLSFSIATIVNPDILIIDEILAVGDVNFRKKSHDKIKSLMDGGTTVLLVSHSIPQIREICDKAIWLDNGKIKEIGEVNKVCDNYIKDAEKASNEQLVNIKLHN